MKFNQDTITALCLLVVCGVVFADTFRMDPAMFGQMPATLWPRMILAPLALLSVLLLVNAQRAEAGDTPCKSLSEWFSYYKNPIVCFFLFFLFLITMPIMGMLLGGLAYVFLTLSFLGGWSRAKLIQHALVTLICVVGMWLIFTQALGVFLPEGILLRVY
ncbi:tripartite tricarboxylate transporter TctB family protein [Planktotalea sp.]|uniref:tripartite tricarboxylate transporter TctB family protein n=1 Tax=Planktotalea sp. TaxID=2029877 RepID=UPI003296D925